MQAFRIGAVRQDTDPVACCRVAQHDLAIPFRHRDVSLGVASADECFCPVKMNLERSGLALGSSRTTDVDVLAIMTDRRFAVEDSGVRLRR